MALILGHPPEYTHTPKGLPLNCQGGVGWWQVFGEFQHWREKPHFFPQK
ncbi:conserved hypothetical protein [Klebsiella grimontii]|uniref:Uncharacterized protein n=1 Tax=Klebsiella grimontii TaxID=2058152 RepID=A0A285B5F2_9ENTR|nr:conserved hypothetical protein [Klebsiella grimontii]